VGGWWIVGGQIIGWCTVVVESASAESAGRRVPLLAEGLHAVAGAQLVELGQGGGVGGSQLGGGSGLCVVVRFGAALVVHGAQCARRGLLGTLRRMDYSVDVQIRSVDRALDTMLGVARRLDAEQLNRRPHGDGTNAAASLVVHCCAVVEFWFGHIALGRPSTRDRDGEFDATATHDELDELVAATKVQSALDLAMIDAPHEELESEIRVFLPGSGDDVELVLHVIEELYQHLGHMELAADAVLAVG